MIGKALDRYHGLPLNADRYSILRARIAEFQSHYRANGNGRSIRQGCRYFADPAVLLASFHGSPMIVLTNPCHRVLRVYPAHDREH